MARSPQLTGARLAPGAAARPAGWPARPGSRAVLTTVPLPGGSRTVTVRAEPRSFTVPLSESYSRTTASGTAAQSFDAKSESVALALRLSPPPPPGPPGRAGDGQAGSLPVPALAGWPGTRIIE